MLGIALGALAMPVCGFLEKKLRLSRCRAALIAGIGAYLLFLAAAGLLLYWLCRELVVFLTGSGYFNYDALAPEVRRVLSRHSTRSPRLPNGFPPRSRKTSTPSCRRSAAFSA